jgi:hypothetical protein
LHNGGSTKKVRKKSSKKSSKKSLKKKFEKKFRKCLKKSLLKKFKNITNCRREGGEGREGGELSFQCLRPSTSLMAAGKNASLVGEYEKMLARPKLPNSC